MKPKTLCIVRARGYRAAQSKARERAQPLVPHIELGSWSAGMQRAICGGETVEFVRRHVGGGMVVVKARLVSQKGWRHHLLEEAAKPSAIYEALCRGDA